MRSTRPDDFGRVAKQWLQEIHPTACVRAIDDSGEDDNSEFWAKYTVRILGSAPEVVFTSEDYGEAYAHFLGCRHVMVDRERTHVPVSARAIRMGPYVVLGVSGALRSGALCEAG
jgi:HTH-type transcriptional regulator, transcriptional repressor of NAD biosynthesis genes